MAKSGLVDEVDTPARAGGGRRVPPRRPSRLTPAVARTICDLLRIGAYLETAAHAVGISREALYEWLRKGHEARTRQAAGEPVTADAARYAAFVADVLAAAATAELRDLQRIEAAAAQGDWQAAAWRLERRYPSRYGTRSAARMTLGLDGLTATTAVGEPVLIELELTSPRGAAAGEAAETRQLEAGPAPDDTSGETS